MKRKVIAIALVSEAKYSHHLYALCDDGTIWSKDLGVNIKPEWQAVEGVPQPDPPTAQQLDEASARFAEMKKKLSGKGRTAVEPS